MSTKPINNKVSEKLCTQTLEERQSANSLVSTETLADLRDGDHEAFGDVFVSYYEKVKYFIFMLVKSSDLAEELAQDIFANLWEHRDRVDPYKNFNAYIYTIARNSVYNYAKSRSVRERYVNFNSSPENDFSPAEAEELIEAKETELLVEMAVSRMPKQRRKIFELSRNDGMSNEEIALRLDITRNAVDKQLRLALSDIRNLITILGLVAL